MLNRARGWAEGLNAGRVLALVFCAAAAGYAVWFREFYVFLFAMPFFALGCRHGKHPAALLALSLLPATVLVIVSVVKFTLVGVPLVSYDHYFLRKNVAILAFNDWHVATGLVVGAIITALYLRALLSGRGAFTRFERIGLFLLALISGASLFNLHGEALDNAWEAEANTPTLRTLVKSAQVPRPHLQMEMHASNQPSGYQPAPTVELRPPAEGLPDIFLVLEESTFPPSMLQPDYKEEKLFAADGTAGGPLHVHTFAGGTWRTEFSVTVGMKPQEFGGDGLYVFHQLEGRIKRSIFSELKKLGYRTMVFYPVPGSFINASAFYASIGVDEFNDPPSLGVGTGWDWKFPDTVLYDAMLKKLDGVKEPVVALLVTINQHGPHDITDPMSDYVARYQSSDHAYKSFIGALEKRGRKAGVVAFGDHQPSFTPRFIDDEQARFITAYEIRCVNFACGDTASSTQKPLDAIMLAPEALERFGFGLDSLSHAQREIFSDCEANVDLCSTAARLKFNTAFAAFFD